MAKDKRVTEKNKAKWGPRDSNKDGIVTVEENKKYKADKENAGKTMKATKKALKNDDAVYMKKLLDSGFYSTEQAPSYVDKYEWEVQKYLLQKGLENKGIPVSNNTVKTESSPVQTSISGASPAFTPVSATPTATPTQGATPNATPNANATPNNNTGANASANATTNAGNKVDTGSTAINTALTANDRMAQNAEVDLASKNETYKANNGVDLIKGKVNYDSTGKQLQEAISSGKNYKSAIDNDEEIVGYRGAKDIINTAIKSQKKLDRGTPKLQKSLTAKLENNKKALESQILGMVGTGASDNEITNQIQAYNDTIAQLKDGKINEMEPIIEQYGDEEDKQDFAALKEYWNNVQLMVNAGVPLDKAAEQLKEIDRMIEYEKKNDEVIVNAKNEHKREITDFLYYLKDDLVTFVLSFVALANGDVGTAYNVIKGNAMNKRNQSYSEAETGYKTNLIDAGNKVNYNSITGKSDASKEMEMVITKLEQDRALNGLTEEQKIQAVDAAYKAFLEYQEKATSDPTGKYSVYQLGTLDTGNPYANAVLKAISYTAVNFESFRNLLNGLSEKFEKGFASGGIVGQAGGASMGPDNTTIKARDGEMVLNAEQQKNLFDFINGKTDGWLDNALNNAKTPQSDPMVAIDKQNQLAQAAQARAGAQLPPSPPVQSPTGFGRTNLA